jgi:hypothetical protein
MDILDNIVDLIWMSSQNRKVNDLRQEVDRLRQSAASSAATDPARAQLDQLRATCGELRLCVAVLFRALEAKGILGREELAGLVDRVDAEDGKLDRTYSGDVLPAAHS